MQSERAPRVSLGMPVYNGEPFIVEALDSLLAQTFEDFEIVICDNASTDGTEEICRMYAEKDERIRYFRNRTNYGYINNFNLTFRLARGEYFKWCASDDIHAPEYLHRAVDVLDSDPTIVLTFPLIVGIDKEGNRRNKPLPGQVTDRDTPETVSSPDPVVRFRKLMRHMWWVDSPFYGLMRSDVLAQTTLHPFHISGDQLLVAQMCVKGRLYEIPEELFFSRYHSDTTSTRQKTWRKRVELVANRPLGNATAWWKIVTDHPERLLGYAAAVRSGDLSLRQRLVCYYEIARTIFWWARLRLYGKLSRWREFPSLRPDYPPRQDRSAGVN